MPTIKSIGKNDEIVEKCVKLVGSSKPQSRTHWYPGWSPRVNLRWTALLQNGVRKPALFQRFHKFQSWSALFQNRVRKPALFQRFHKLQRWSALFQKGLRKPALISACSEWSKKTSAGYFWYHGSKRLATQKSHFLRKTTEFYQV